MILQSEHYLLVSINNWLLNIEKVEELCPPPPPTLQSGGAIATLPQFLPPVNAL